MKIEIKNRWNGAVIFECEASSIREACEQAATRFHNLRNADLGGADLRDADLGGADLRNADLRNADLGGADLRNANLRGANLRNANLRDADLEQFRVDFFDVLLRARSNGEVTGLIAALKAGKVDGSTYEGDCACLVGTLAKERGCRYDQIPNLVPNSSRPAEQFFTNIRKGDTPETNQCSAIAVKWAEDFQQIVSAWKR